MEKSHIRLNFKDYSIEARLHDTPTAKAIYDALPISSQVNTWGDEIYFHVPVRADLEEGSKSEVSIGDLAYWPSMPAFCIFFGPTPASSGSQPVAASAVNVFGTLIETETEKLQSIRDGEIIEIIEV